MERKNTRRWKRIKKMKKQDYVCKMMIMMTH